MGVYIPDMEMPKDGYRQLFLTAEGEVIYFPSTPKNGEVRKKAIVVPNHGDLIDRDAFVKFIKENWSIYDQWIVGVLDARPTVIPAEPPKEET